MEVKKEKSTKKYVSIRERLWQTVFPKETLDPTPVAVPVRRPLTLREEMQRFIRTELSQEMAARGEPTFEEEDDFEIDDYDDDLDLTTQYTIPDEMVRVVHPEHDMPADDLNGSPEASAEQPNPPEGIPSTTPPESTESGTPPTA